MEGSGIKLFELLPPTPSPLFPRDLPTLMKLGDDEVKTLVSDYGLLTPHLNESVERSREDNLNRFLSYIGVSSIRFPVYRFAGFKPLHPSRSVSNW